MNKDFKMNFEQRYLFYTEENEEYEKAKMLWLWYDYQTEIYDQELWSNYPAPDDETMVLHHSPEARSLSNQNALKLRQRLLEIARIYNIPKDTLQDAKNSGYRNKSKMQKLINDYLILEERGAFQFIYKLN